MYTSVSIYKYGVTNIYMPAPSAEPHTYNMCHMYDIHT